MSLGGGWYIVVIDTLIEVAVEFGARGISILTVYGYGRCVFRKVLFFFEQAYKLSVDCIKTLVVEVAMDFLLSWNIFPFI